MPGTPKASWPYVLCRVVMACYPPRFRRRFGSSSRALVDSSEAHGRGEGHRLLRDALWSLPGAWFDAVTGRPTAIPGTRAPLRSLARDFRYAGRALRRAPGFTSAVVLTLALAAAAGGVLAGEIYDTLVRPLPFTDGLYMIVGPSQHEGLSFPNFDDIRSRTRNWRALAAYRYPYAVSSFHNGE